MARVLIAGVGNVFLGDDGFGVEVVRRLCAEPLPRGVELLDVGIRGMHFAYRLLEDYDLVIAVDAVARGGAPGTLYVLEPRLDELPDGAAAPDAHSIDLASVLATARTLGAQPRRVLVVGCEPADLDERMGLTATVEAAVDEAVRRVRQLAEGAAAT